VNGAFIYLIGFAGCGKLTIAQAIQMRCDCILVDNHFVNNVIFALIDPDGKTKLPDQVWENVRRVRAAVLDTIRDVAKPGRTFIFTNELLEGEEQDRQLFLEIAELARHRSALFLPVRLTISPVELARRVVAPGRAERLKAIDPQAALTKAREREVLRPHGFSFLEIDVTTTTAEEVAEGILAGLRKMQTA
jgi:Chloramphenicol phosphotransferase-like protein